jgi:hypothetical protein
VLYPLCIPLMTVKLTVSIDLLYVVSFPAVDIPRLLPWVRGRQILVFLLLLDRLFADWYGEKVYPCPCRHPKALPIRDLATPSVEGLSVSVNS